MNEDHTSTVSLGFGQYLFVLRRQWRVVVAGAVLGALAAAAYVSLTPQTVTATTTINLNVITTEPFSAQRAASGLLDDATETAIARSHIVASRAADLLDGAVTAAEIRSASTVSTSSGAAVVTVDFDAATAAQAIEGADAVASAYLSFRGDQARERIAVMVDNITERIDALNVSLEASNLQLTSAEPNSAAYAQASTQRQQILTELDGLLSERNGLQSVDTTGGLVLSAAADNELGFSPGRTVTLLTGLAAGLIGGLVVAFLRNPFDQRLRDAEELSRALQAPVFATLQPPYDHLPAGGAAADGLRVARERMLVDLSPDSTVLLVDATRGERLAATALNIAVMTAQAGHEVQVVIPEQDDELHGRLAAAFGLDGAAGGAARSTIVPTLTVFVPDDSGDELAGDSLLSAHTRAAIAHPGVLTFLVLSTRAPAASILAGLRAAQAVVVVAREGSTRGDEVRAVRDEAETMGCAVLGAVAERAPKRRRVR